MQIGQVDLQTYYNKGDADLVVQASSWVDYPTEENPTAKFKFTSVLFSLNKDVLYTSRSTYSFLDWLGDIGGLVDALFLIGEIFMGPLATYTLQSKLVASIVRSHIPSPPPA